MPTSKVSCETSGMDGPFKIGVECKHWLFVRPCSLTSKLTSPNNEVVDDLKETLFHLAFMSASAHTRME